MRTVAIAREDEAFHLRSRYVRAVNWGRRVQDPLLGLVFFGIAETSALSGAEDGSRWVTVPAAALIALPLALRRSRPLGAPFLIAAGLALQSILAVSPTSIWVIPIVMLGAYSPAANLRLGPALVGGAAMLGGSWLLSLLDDTNGGYDKIFTAPIFTVLPWAVGRVVRRLADQRRELAELALALEHEREERERTVVELERARIARELHDVVAHAVSLIVVQSAAGDSLLDDSPVRAREAFRTIESTGRAALVEMRRMVGLLRGDGRSLLTPQPTLSGLDRLVDQLRDAGLEVDFEIASGAGNGLPAGLELAAYRLVQEALTNVVKHANASNVYIRVRRTPAAIELDVRDDGCGSAGPNEGHGLVGMRERVAMFGGEISAGSADGGGFRVHARLPL